MFGKSLDTFSELGGNWWMARVLAETGRSLLELGNHLEAGRVWRKSLRIATETHSTPVVLGAFLDLASLQARQGDLEEALEWLLIVLAHPASFEETRQRGEQLRTELEAQLTSRQIEAAQARAQCTSFKAAIATILQGKSAGHRYMPN